jgi:Major capsid protein Gp23
MYLSEELEKRWSEILDSDDMPTIKDPYRRAVTAVILENQVKEGFNSLMEAAPTTSVSNGGVQNYDPIMAAMLRRAMPNLMAYELAGVQPMVGPTGLVFSMRSTYTNMAGVEALFNEADTLFTGTNAAQNTSGTGSHVGSDPVSNVANSNTYTVGKGMTTAQAEALGDSGGNAFPEMSFVIEKISVTARSRNLKATYSMEIAQDLKAIHALDVETELVNILSTEILAEINREMVRHIYRTATVGAQTNTTVAGVFDLDLDSNGRWLVEKFKGLVFQIEREANAIARATRRGKGNIVIVSSDVASALALAGVLDYTPALAASINLTVDDTGQTFAGTMNGGRTKVFIDPYYGGSINGNELCVVGYKGSSPWDAGIFYCPYVPLQMMRAQNDQTFQPAIGFKTRYGIVANPYATAAKDGVVGDRNTANQANIYYRIFLIKNLM